MAERRGVRGEGHLVPVERPAVMRDGLVIDPAPAAFVVGAGDELSLGAPVVGSGHPRSEEHTSELQSLMRISYAVFCLKKKKQKQYTPEYQIEKTNNKRMANQPITITHITT